MVRIFFIYIAFQKSDDYGKTENNRIKWNASIGVTTNALTI